MTQLTMQDVLDVFPNGRICKWLKIEDDTGIMEKGEVFIMGTCKLFSGVVYDRSCYDCCGYEAI